MSLVVPVTVFAQISNPITSGTLAALLVEVIRIIILIAVPVVILAVIYAGFLFVTAGGNEQKLTQAKQIFFWSLVGGLILFGGQAIAEGLCATVETIAAMPICG